MATKKTTKKTDKKKPTKQKMKKVQWTFMYKFETMEATIHSTDQECAWRDDRLTAREDAECFGILPGDVRLIKRTSTYEVTK